MTTGIYLPIQLYKRLLVRQCVTLFLNNQFFHLFFIKFVNNTEGEKKEGSRTLGRDASAAASATNLMSPSRNLAVVTYFIGEN